MPRRSAATNKKIANRKPSASNQKAQILALNHKVNQNTKKLEGVRYKVQHYTRIADVVQATALNQYYAWPLNRPSQMNQVFSAPDEALGGKYNFDLKGRMFMDLAIKSNNEPTPLNLSCFIVRPKTSKVALSAELNVAYPSPLFNAMKLINGVDYVTNVGLAMMNKKRWHIDKHWNVTTAPIRAPITIDPPTAWQSDLRPIRRTFRGPNVLKLNNRTGNWKDTLDHAVNPNQRQFLVIFNNNQSTDTSPTVNASILFTAFTSE